MTDILPKVLIIDDEPPVREYLCEALANHCAEIAAVASFHRALEALELLPYDILLADICMPGATGIDLLALSQQLEWDCSVILMTGHADLQHVAAGVRLRAADLLLKPFTLEALERSIQKTFDNLQRKRQTRIASGLLSDDLRKRTEQLEVTRQLLNESYRSALETLVATLEAREPETYAHSFRVRGYALHMASLMHYPQADFPRLSYAALLHDIGKVAVPDLILLKPGPLTREEFEVLKAHSVVGERIVGRISFLNGASEIVRHHHERWDGRGYPDGIEGSKIPFGARLFAVADTLDAMTSNRCYRGCLTLDEARMEIRRCSGTQFDPLIAHVFDRVPKETWAQLRHQADCDARMATMPRVTAEKIPAPLVRAQQSPVTAQL